MGRSGKRIGLKMIAEKAGVSMATVSLALSDHPNVNAETKQRIMRLSRELGYVTTRDLNMRKARRKVKRLGFVAIGTSLHSGHRGFLEPLEREAEQYGMQVEAISMPSQDPDEVLQQLLTFGKTVDGLLVTDNVNSALLQALDVLERPVLAFGHTKDRDDEALSLEHVRILAPDETAVTRCATAWLYRRGRRQVAFAAPQLPGGGSDDRQFDGWRLASLDAGHAPVAEDIYIAGTASASIDIADFFLRRTSLPDAYYVTDVRLARHLIDALSARGVALSPEQVVFHGPRSYILEAGLGHHPHIELDFEKMARTAAAIMARPDRRVLEEGIRILYPLPMNNFTD